MLALAAAGLAAEDAKDTETPSEDVVIALDAEEEKEEEEDGDNDE